MNETLTLESYHSLALYPPTATFGSPPGIFKAVWASGGLTNNPGELSGKTEESEPHLQPSHPHGIPDMDEGESSGNTRFIKDTLFFFFNYRNVLQSHGSNSF